MDRTILHVDCNSFYASVSLLYKPHLRDLPVAVGGDPESRHGIILAKNQVAKKYRIPTGAALWQAKQLCPNLIVIPPDYELYGRFSDEIKHHIFTDYTDIQESFGSDESWLDVTGSAHLFGGGMSLAEEIRERIKREMGITVSIGVSWNKIFAKLGSDMKKPDAVTLITKESYKEQVWPLPVEELLYVGPATKRKLHSKGVMTIGDLATTEVVYLRDWFGVVGEYLWVYANGQDASPVSQTSPPDKSVGSSSVFNHDITDINEAERCFHWLSETLGPQMRKKKVIAKTVEIMVCDNNMGYITRQRSMPPTNLNIDLAESAFRLFKDTYPWKKPVRKLGIRGSNLMFANAPYQISFEQSAEQHAKRERLEESMDSLNNRWPHIVRRAVSVGTEEQQKLKDFQRQFSPVSWL